MHRAFFGNGKQHRALFLGKVALQFHFAFNEVQHSAFGLARFAVLAVNFFMAQSHRYFFQRNLFAARDNANSH